MLNYRINSIYDSYTKELFKDKYTIQNFFLKHERRQKFINNLVVQMRAVEASPLLLDAEKFEATVKDVIRFFFATALRHKEESILSDNEKSRRIKEYEKNDLEKIVNAEECKVDEV